MITLSLKDVNEILRCLFTNSDDEELIGKLIREQKRLKQSTGEWSNGDYNQGDGRSRRDSSEQ